jgi:hypothetical protein
VPGGWRALIRSTPAGIAIALGGVAYGALTLNEPGSREHASAWNLAVDTANDPHFITWIVLTAWLLRILVRRGASLTDGKLISWGSYRRLVLGTLRSALHPISAAICALGVAWMIASTSLQLPWTADPATGTAAGRFLASGIPTPVGLLVQVALVCTVLLVLEVLFLTLQIAWDKPAIEIMVALGLWLWAGSAATGLVPADSPLNAGFYLNASLVGLSPEATLTAVTNMVLAVVVCAGTIAECDRRVRGKPSRWAAPALWFAGASIAVVTISMATQNLQQVTLVDALSTVFLGSAGTMAQFFTSTFIFIGYAYLFGARLSTRGTGWIQLELLRYGSHSRWYRQVGSHELVKALTFIAVLLGTACVSYVLLGGRDFAPPAAGMAAWLFHFLVNGVLQLAVYLIIIFGATWLFPSRAGVLVATATLVVLAYLQSAPTLRLPVQLSGMAFAAGGWPTVLAATASLLAAFVIAAALLPILFRWQQRRS